MNCMDCNACQSDAGYEHDATDFCCEIGQDNESGPDENELGCNLTEEEIEKLLPLANELNEKAFAEQCDSYVKWAEESMNQTGTVQEIEISVNNENILFYDVPVNQTKQTEKRS